MRKCVTGKCTNQSEEEIIYQGHCLECANLHLSNVDPRFKFLGMTYEEVASLRAELAAEKDKLAKVVGALRDIHHTAAEQTIPPTPDDETVNLIWCISGDAIAALEAAKE